MKYQEIAWTWPTFSKKLYMLHNLLRIMAWTFLWFYFLFREQPWLTYFTWLTLTTKILLNYQSPDPYIYLKKLKNLQFRHYSILTFYLTIVVFTRDPCRPWLTIVINSSRAEKWVSKKARKINKLKVTNLTMLMISALHEDKICICNLCSWGITPIRIAKWYCPTCSKNKTFESHMKHFSYQALFLMKENLKIFVWSWQLQGEENTFNFGRSAFMVSHSSALDRCNSI